MAKNKGQFGKGKPHVEPEDEFVSGVNRVLGKLKPFAKQLLIGGAVILIAVFAAVGYNMIQQRKQAHATALYDQAVVIYQQSVMSAEEADDSLAARAGKVLELLDELQAEYGSTDIAKRALLLHAGALYDAGRFDDAAAMYRRAAATDISEQQKAIAREGIGYALEARALAATDPNARKQGLEQALAAFEKVQTKDDGVYRDYALYHQARVLQTLERTDEAVSLYNKVLDTQPTTALRATINQRPAVLAKPANDGR